MKWASKRSIIRNIIAIDMEQKQKILIIEDDPLIRDLYRDAFRLNDFEVEIAENGIDGLRILKNFAVKPCVILLDIMMPNMNGFDVLEQFKKNSETKDIPVVILSNLAQRQDIDKALKLGAVMYLVKAQHSPKDIIEKIKQIIQDSSK
ncbi:MAG: response regulator [Thermoproteota archaeon]